MDGRRPYKAYSRHYARMGNERPNWELAEAEPRKLACKKPWLPRDLGAHILDFGCGWGYQLMSLWASGYRYLEGIEVAEDQAKYAEMAAQGKVRIHCIDGREYLKGKNKAYDLIILNDVLEHIPISEIPHLLKMIWSALLPGGTLVVRVPNASSICASYSRYLDMTHVVCFTEYSLIQYLEQAGFANHKIVPDDLRITWSGWRPWRPCRGLGIRPRLNRWFHQFVYWLRGQYPTPTVYGMNLEVYSQRPLVGEDVLLSRQ